MKPSFRRDRITWLAYFGLAYYAYLEAVLGPIMPFLRDELKMSYSVTGLHFSAMAVGTILGGVTVDAVVNRRGRRMALWGGGVGMALGVLVLAAGLHAAVTIVGTFLMGFLGCFVINTAQAIMSDKYGEMRTVAFSEANMMASLGASMSPLLIWFFQEIDFGWRGAMYVMIALWMVVLLRFRHEPLPEASASAAEDPGTPGQPLPRIFWAYWLIVFLVVAVERCMVFWGAEFLKDEGGLSKVDASSAMWLLFVAMLIGRFVASRVARTRPTRSLMLITILVATVGFPLFWLASPVALRLLGLFITGLGLANFFPMTMSLAASAAPDQPDKAIGRAMLGSGLTTLIMPQLLGGIADQTDIQTAFGIVAVLLVSGAAMTVLAKRYSVRQVGVE
ncbi:MAG: MFS transporter [Anaerolineae bacterium]|nr:MFS transporter [Anaerolineae bacterium]